MSVWLGLSTTVFGKIPSVISLGGIFFFKWDWIEIGRLCAKHLVFPEKALMWTTVTELKKAPHSPERNKSSPRLLYDLTHGINPPMSPRWQPALQISDWLAHTVMWEESLKSIFLSSLLLLFLPSPRCFLAITVTLFHHLLTSFGQEETCFQIPCPHMEWVPSHSLLQLSCPFSSIPSATRSTEHCLYWTI